MKYFVNKNLPEKNILPWFTFDLCFWNESLDWAMS
jgi:hypothetical protein